MSSSQTGYAAAHIVGARGFSGADGAGQLGHTARNGSDGLSGVRSGDSPTSQSATTGIVGSPDARGRPPPLAGMRERGRSGSSRALMRGSLTSPVASLKPEETGTLSTQEVARDLRAVLDPSPVTVHIRCRPEVVGDAAIAATASARGSLWARVEADEEENIITVLPGPAAPGMHPVQYGFDAVLAEPASQEAVYRKSCASLVDHALSGLNTALFAYGPSGTGKTHTLIGDLMDPAGAGIICRAVHAVFEALEAEGVPRRKRLVQLSCLEIYNEQMTDLLWLPSRGAGSEPKPPQLRIAEDPKRGAVCVGLSAVALDQPSDAFAVLAQATEASHRAATALNRDSNRSHRLFFLCVSYNRSLGASAAVSPTPSVLSEPVMRSGALSPGTATELPSPGSEPSPPASRAGGADDGPDRARALGEQAEGAEAEAEAEEVPRPGPGWSRGSGLDAGGGRGRSWGEAPPPRSSARSLPAHRRAAGADGAGLGGRGRGGSRASGAGGSGWEVEGCLTLVDLAGSESVGRNSGGGGGAAAPWGSAGGPPDVAGLGGGIGAGARAAALQQLAAETGNINRSLLTLGRVIGALANRERRVPYRDSKLTRLCAEALGGRCKTVVLGTLAPARGMGDDTRTALDFLARAKEALNVSQAPITEQLALALARTRERLTFVQGELRRRETYHDLEVRSLRDTMALADSQAQQLLTSLREQHARDAETLLQEKERVMADLRAETAEKLSAVEEARDDAVEAARTEATEAVEAAEQRCEETVQAERDAMEEELGAVRAEAAAQVAEAEGAAAEAARRAESRAAALVKAARQRAAEAVARAAEDADRAMAAARAEWEAELQLERRRHKVSMAQQRRRLLEALDVTEAAAQAAEEATAHASERAAAFVEVSRGALSAVEVAGREAAATAAAAAAAASARCGEAAEQATEAAVQARARARETEKEDLGAAAALQEAAAAAEARAAAVAEAARDRLMAVIGEAVGAALREGVDGTRAVAELARDAATEAASRARRRAEAGGVEAGVLTAKVRDWASIERQEASNAGQSVTEAVARMMTGVRAAADGAADASSAVNAAVRGMRETVVERLRGPGAAVMNAGVEACDAVAPRHFRGHTAAEEQEDEQGDEQEADEFAEEDEEQVALLEAEANAAGGKLALEDEGSQGDWGLGGDSLEDAIAALPPSPSRPLLTPPLAGVAPQTPHGPRAVAAMHEGDGDEGASPWAGGAEDDGESDGEQQDDGTDDLYSSRPLVTQRRDAMEDDGFVTAVMTPEAHQ